MFWENRLLSQVNHRFYRNKKVVDCVILVLLILICISLCSSAKASPIQSQIIDNAAILSEYQKDSIQQELSTIKKIPIIVVINDVGSRCTDDYAYSSAKLLYQDLFSYDEEGLVIVYCCSLEGYKVGIYYQGSNGIDAKKLKNKIVSEYSLYTTDSSWIEGSTISCIKSINALIQPTITSAPEEVPQENFTPHQTSFWEKYGKYQLVVSILFTVFVAGVATAIIVYRKHRKQIDKDIAYWFNNTTHKEE